MDDDVNEFIECDDCGAEFSVTWKNKGYAQEVEWCPFCAEPVDDYDDDDADLIDE